MAFKRQIDRLPIIPADAKVHNVTCHYLHRRLRLSRLQLAGEQAGRHSAAARTPSASTSPSSRGPRAEAWYAPSMYNIVKQDGRDVHIVIKPDQDCVVNSGLGSIRGARMAEISFSVARQTQQQRLTDPLVWR